MGSVHTTRQMSRAKSMAHLLYEPVFVICRFISFVHSSFRYTNRLAAPTTTQTRCESESTSEQCCWRVWEFERTNERTSEHVLNYVLPLYPLAYVYIKRRTLVNTHQCVPSCFCTHTVRNCSTRTHTHTSFSLSVFFVVFSVFVCIREWFLFFLFSKSLALTSTAYVRVSLCLCVGVDMCLSVSVRAYVSYIEFFKPRPEIDLIGCYSIAHTINGMRVEVSFVN